MSPSSGRATHGPEMLLYCPKWDEVGLHKEPEKGTWVVCVPHHGGPGGCADHCALRPWGQPLLRGRCGDPHACLTPFQAPDYNHAARLDGNGSHQSAITWRARAGGGNRPVVLTRPARSRGASRSCPPIQNGSSVAVAAIAGGPTMRSRRWHWSPAGIAPPSFRLTRFVRSAATTTDGRSLNPRRKRPRRNRSAGPWSHGLFVLFAHFLMMVPFGLDLRR